MQNWQILNSFKYVPGNSESLKNLIANLLKNRGIEGRAAVSAFLNPDLDLVTPENLGIPCADLEKAGGRIRKAIKDKEKIVVYTDYDADGICSGAILWETLHSMKAQVMPFVPDRIKEGYGLSKAGIDKIKKELDPGLIITVDHGITRSAEVLYAKSLGMEIIIVDHHLPPAELPAAAAIVHTLLLCATGLSWVFANYLLGKRQDNLLDLVALATVADLVPLTGANRTLVKFGLEAINKTRRLGLKELIFQAGLKKGGITAYSLSHMLAPRLNAAGRLTNALDALRLLCTKDADRAKRLAFKLNSVNRDRQNLSLESTVMAKSLVTGDDKIIMVSHESFHQGIIGLIAGKLTDKYKRPSIVLSVGEEYCKASVRSVKGVNIVEILRSASELLVDIGGHPMAAGFTVRTENLGKLKVRISELAENMVTENDLDESLVLDLLLDPSVIDMDFHEMIGKLAPFGQGNREPLFGALGLRVLDYRLVGREKNHLKLSLTSDLKPDKIIQAIGFNMSGIFPDLALGTRLDLAYVAEKDSWDGQDRLILKLKDARLSP